MSSVWVRVFKPSSLFSPFRDESPQKRIQFSHPRFNCSLLPQSILLRRLGTLSPLQSVPEEQDPTKPSTEARKSLTICLTKADSTTRIYQKPCQSLLGIFQVDCYDQGLPTSTHVPGFPPGMVPCTHRLTCFITPKTSYANSTPY